MGLIYQWTEVHSAIISAFLKKCSSSNIKNFILRNYEGLPEHNSSKDVDIIIEPGSYKQCLHILLNTYKEANFDYYYVMNYERAHCVYGFDSINKLSIHIDIIEGYANKGYELFEFDELYNNTIDYKFFKVLNPTYDAIMLLFYKIVGVRELKQKYQDKISDIYKTNKSDIDNILRRKLDFNCSNQVIMNLESSNYINIESNAYLIGKSAKKHFFKRNVVNTIIGKYKFLKEKAYNIIWCPKKMQKMIVVEAPDGTGKTTFIDNLIILIAKNYVADVSKSRVYHFRPSYLPNLGAAGEKVGVMKQDKDFTNPHRAKPAGFISSLIRMTYYWMDYLIGVPLILRKNAQFDKITIFDRYIYDFLVDPYRSRIMLPLWLRRVYARCVKQPQITFVLDADADTIYARKQELTKEEIERQLVEFRKLKKYGKNVFILDATKTPEKIAEDAMKIILDKFTVKL